MRQIALFAAAAMVSLAAPAQDLLRNANQDVLNGLVYNGRPEARMTVTRSIPDALSGLKIPDGFALIGTAVRTDGNSHTAFRTSLQANAALEALVIAFAEQGWEVEAPQQGMQPTFSTSNDSALQTVCRNGERRMLQVRSIQNVRYARIHALSDPRPRACNAPTPAIAGPGGFEIMRRQMPRFTFPAGVRVDTGGGSSGGNNSMNAITRIHSPDQPPATLAPQLAQQLTGQGWTRDTSWSGAVGAGSNWTRATDDGTLMGSLEIIDMGDAIYEVRFMLLLL